MARTWDDVTAGVTELAAEWKAARPERQARRHLEQPDFDALRDAGVLNMMVPESMGGLWTGISGSTRPVCNMLRVIARGDPSVSLVSSMHAVIGFWLCAPPNDDAAWHAQLNAITKTAADGKQWGTITSEPGSGGDIARTTAVAKPDDTIESALPGATYRVSGLKHFGSGSGITDYMITTAVPDGEDKPALFVLDVAGRAWDGSEGLQLVAEWDGMGMAATQSHAMKLVDCPAIRAAWTGPIEDLTFAAAPLVANMFAAVVLGVLDEAIATAKEQLRDKADTMRAYEQVEWTRAEADYWMATQVFEGSLRAVESGDHAVALHAAIRAKQGIAEIAESTLSRLARVIGGGTFARRSPFSAWFEDVRALGFLRPPWGLAYDTLFLTSFG